jgi:hypothetical protein
MASLDREQKSIVQAILQESRKIKDPVARRKFKRAAVQTGLVESNLRNLNHGDADSQGWRQERASLYPNPTNVKASVRRFREEFEQHYDPGERASDVAGQVQRPAAQYLGRYQERAGEAKSILREFGGGGGGSSPAPGYRTDPQRVSLPGVDNSGLRQGALQQYVLDRGKPDSLLTLGSTLRGARDQPSSSFNVGSFYKGQPREQQKQRGGAKSAESLGDEIGRYASKLGLSPGSRDRDPAHNAAVGGSSDSDHIEAASGYKGREGVDIPTTAAQGGWGQYQKVVGKLGIPLDKGGFSQGTITRGGKKFRVQVIFGDAHKHGDHIHVGFRRVG